jgi:hypothetical protein
MSLKFLESILPKKNYKIFCLSEQKTVLIKRLTPFAGRFAADHWDKYAPDGMKSQIKGNMLQSLSRALKEEVRFDGSRITSVAGRRTLSSHSPTPRRWRSSCSTNRTSRRWARASLPPSPRRLPSPMRSSMPAAHRRALAPDAVYAGEDNGKLFNAGGNWIVMISTANREVSKARFLRHVDELSNLAIYYH